MDIPIEPPGVKTVPRKSFDTPSLRVDRYWRKHPVRAFQLMRALMRSNPNPYERDWPQFVTASKWCALENKHIYGVPKPKFRIPPQPYKYGCPMCGLTRYSLGWHTDWDAKGMSDRGYWHKACAAAFRMMQTPNEFANFFKDRQNNICAITGVSLAGTKYNIDHMIPLYRVYRDFGHLPIDQIVGFWGPKNLRAISLKAHAAKNKHEARERSSYAGKRPSDLQ